MTNAALALVFIGAPLGFSLSGADPYVLPKLWILAAAALAFAISAAPERRAWSKLDETVLLFLVVVACCAARSIDVPMSLLGQYASHSDELLPCLILAALYFGASRATADSAKAAAPRFLAAAGAVMALWGFCQAAGHDPVPYWPLPTGRITATMGSPVYAGAVLALAWVAAFHLTLSATHRRERALGAVAAILIAAALYLTRSRGAWLAAGAAIPAYLVLAGRVSLGRTAGLALAGAVLAAVAVASSVMWAGVKDQARLELWRTAAEIAIDNPLDGAGPGTFGLEFRRRKSPLFTSLHRSSRTAQAQAHNEPLQFAATMGLLGLLAYAGVACGLAAAVFRSTEPGLRALVGASAAAYAVQAQVNPVPTAATAILAVLAGLLAASQATTWYGPSRGLWGLRAAAAGAFAVVSLMSAADSAFKEGLALEGAGMDPASAYHTAALANPLELNYWAKMVGSLNSKTVTVEPERRPLVAERSLQLAGLALRLHPYHPEAWELAARSDVLEAVVNQDLAAVARAKAKLERAEELAPLFDLAVAQRLKLCSLVRDRACERLTAAKLSEIRRLEAM